MGSKKKRIVYTYPDDFNTVLKLITYLMLRKYDGIFSKGLYSFRPGLAAKDAVMMLKRDPDLGRYYSYKVDISNYFNSIIYRAFCLYCAIRSRMTPSCILSLPPCFPNPRRLTGAIP